MANNVNINSNILFFSTNPSLPNTANVGCIPLPSPDTFATTNAYKKKKRKRNRSLVSAIKQEFSQAQFPQSNIEDPANILFTSADNSDFSVKKSCPGLTSTPNRDRDTGSVMDVDFNNSCESKSGPNILKKHKRKLNSSSDESLFIGDLDFSPSKFLNLTPLSASLSNVTSCQDMSFASPMKNPTPALSISEADSGITTMGSDVEESTFSMPSLTSTPIGVNPRKQILAPVSVNDEMTSPDYKHDSFSLSQIDMSFENEEINAGTSGSSTFKTPLIRKYLSETAPRTPTPFKCDDRNKHDQQETTPVSKTVLRLQEDNSFSYSVHPKKLFDPQICESSTKKSKRSCKKSQIKVKSEQKKARKALLLDPDGSNNKVVSCLDELATRLPPQENNNEGFLAIESPFTKSQLKVRRLSGLIDNKTVVSQRTNSILHKSVFYTSHTTHNALPGTMNENHSSLNKSWVTVACGKSKDQKDMTEAAKRYLGVKNKTGLSFANVICEKSATINASKFKLKYR